MTWVTYALLSAVFAAMTAILAKIGVHDVDSNLATAIRTVVIVIFAWGIVFATGGYKGLPGLSGKTVLFLILSGLATGASWICYFHALKLGDAVRVAPIDKLSVPIAVIIAVLFLGEKLDWRGWLGVVCITGGALLLIKK